MPDILFSGDFAPLVQKEGISNVRFDGIQTILDSCALHISNLECPVTVSEKPIVKTGPCLKVGQSNMALLKRAKIDIACLANNHIFDYGEDGVRDTISFCKENAIDTIGIVNSPENRPHWIIKEVGNKKLAFVNYCEHEFSVRKDGLLGAKGFDPMDAFAEISLLKKDADYVIVIYHGGNEYYNLPGPHQKKEFRFLADLGADFVIGHHSHVVSGYELYKGKLLVYGLGNFFFPYEGEGPEWNIGLVLKLSLNENYSFDLIPIIQCVYPDLSINIAEGKQKDEILRLVESLSHDIQNDIILQRKWCDFVDGYPESFVNLFIIPSAFDKILLKILGKHMKTKLERRSLLLKNIIQCSSLNKVLTEKLGKFYHGN